MLPAFSDILSAMKKPAAQRFWLLKSEPSCYSIDNFAKDKKAAWGGIRNYQARNFMRDSMQLGDLFLFYHSGPPSPGAVGVGEVCGLAQADESAFDKKDKDFDPKATRANPIWVAPDVKFVSKFKQEVPLARIKIDPKLSGIMVAAKGSRLSVQPLSEAHFRHILSLGEK